MFRSAVQTAIRRDVSGLVFLKTDRTATTVVVRSSISINYYLQHEHADPNNFCKPIKIRSRGHKMPTVIASRAPNVLRRNKIPIKIMKSGIILWCIQGQESPFAPLWNMNMGLFMLVIRCYKYTPSTYFFNGWNFRYPIATLESNRAKSFHRQKIVKQE